MKKFYVGCKVVGNNLASDKYGITKKGTTGIVKELYRDSFLLSITSYSNPHKTVFEGDRFIVRYDCFDEEYNGARGTLMNL